MTGERGRILPSAGLVLIAPAFAALIACTHSAVGVGRAGRVSAEPVSASRDPAAGQDSLAMLVVSVKDAGKALRWAQVDVAMDSSYAGHLRLALTDSLGIATIDSVAFGRAYVRVRRIGYQQHRVIVDVSMRIQRLSVETKPIDVEAMRQEKERVFQEKLAAARSRPRHWNCEVPADTVRAKALATVYLRRSMQPFLGIAPDSASFVRSFRAVSKAECGAIAEAVDRSYGLIDDAIFVFRIGKAFWFPRLGYGILTDNSGKIVVSYVVPD